MAPKPGILYVTMQPSPTLAPAEFHDWYNNEHGPLRLRLPFIENGFRYRASAAKGDPEPSAHEWMAVYDTPDMDAFNGDEYLALRGPPVQSQRERDVRPSVDIDRRAYDLVSERRSPAFERLEDLGNAGRNNVVVSVLTQLKDAADAPELEKWFNEEHGEMISKVPGWLRSRRFARAAIDNKDGTEFMTLHEYRPENGLRGEEMRAATTTPWAKKINGELVANKSRRVYELFYTFGPAPRDLASFAAAGYRDWANEATATKTLRAGDAAGAVESYITTADGARLAYRLEGSTEPDAPVVVLSNSILVEWGIWDAFVSAFLAKRPGFRVLRYHTRGRTSAAGASPVTVDLLAGDVMALLDALRVPKAAALVGVSLGGATVLNAALNFPDRVGAFISCDTNDKSPAGNSKAWKERIATAEKEGATAQGGEAIVGDELAEVTVRRWFVKESYDGAETEKECERVKQMVVNNSLEGFKRSVQALWEYDMQPLMKDAKVKGLFLVGSGDGVLPKTMKDMAERYGSGVECVQIEGAGHLPMVEKPQEVADVLARLVASS